METSVVNVLILVALGLLLAITGGISYLTFAEWRDRRRLDQEQKEQRVKGKRK
ncbi:hypothetical protein [Synechococcus sp. PCC 6312]|uniref:hypothetical protein n=1 Tax=Synechococcus sp. (strain ATCC 27167 / PCC 6312) TaxID=195253 RepID=UPI00029F46E7|nr:hypothetical protein [Synechococcus sp. PCC 6312]AFY62623.1 hypothetical protein Syn6312_3605 [Synechococcus sp. PCC 6312]